MSFMYNPFPYHDPKPVNRPELSSQTISSIVSGGTPAVAKQFVATLADKARKEGVVVGLDGYTTARWDLLVSLMGRECDLLGLSFESVDCNAATLKSGREIDAMIDPLLIWDTKIDPTLLYGKVYHGGYEGLIDTAKAAAFIKDIPARKAPGKMVAVYGYGCLIPAFRDLYDVKCWFDLTPMNASVPANMPTSASSTPGSSTGPSAVAITVISRMPYSSVKRCLLRVNSTGTSWTTTGLICR